MATKFKKSALLEEIQGKIKTCEDLQAKDPDELAANRVATLDKNPCSDGDYFTMITFKTAVSEESDKISDLKKKEENYIYTLSQDEIKKTFLCGCIIEYDLKANKTSVTKFSTNNYFEMIKKLIEKYNSDGCLVKQFDPDVTGDMAIVASLGGYNAHLGDDFKAYKDTYQKVYYAMGQFSNFSKLVETKINKTEVQIYSCTDPFTYPDYFCKYYKTSGEKNVNEGVGKTKDNIKILNEVSNYDKKPTKNAASSTPFVPPVVVDMGSWVVSKMESLRKSDTNLLATFKKDPTSIANKIDTSVAKYDTYKKGFGGSEDWKDWDVVYAQYALFSSRADNETFIKNVQSNGTYFTNVKAYEQTKYIFDNNKKTAKYAFLASDIADLDTSSISVGEAASYVSKNLTDPVIYKVKSKNDDGLEIGSTTTYTILVPIPNDTKVESNLLTGKTITWASTPKSKYKEVKFSVKAKNFKEIERDALSLTDCPTYEYRKASSTFTDGTILTNEITLETTPTIPAESYYSEGGKSFFPTKNLLEKLFEIRLNYSTIPLKVEVKTKTKILETSKFKDTCSEALEKAKKLYEGNILRLCLDTINYDPWEDLIKKLKALYGGFNLMQAKDDYVSMPPIDEPVESSGGEEETCEKCGKPESQCECEKVKLCDKCYPLDFFGCLSRDKNAAAANGSLSAEKSLLDQAVDAAKSLLGLGGSSSKKSLSETDSLLEKMGAINIGAFINGVQGSASYAEIAAGLYEAVYDEKIELKQFNTKTEYADKVLAFDFYKDIAPQKLYKTNGSIASQFRDADFKKFVTDYTEKLGKVKEEKLDLSKEYWSKEIKAGLTGGYAYIPVGEEILFTYEILKDEFLIKGCDSALTNQLFGLLELDDEAYVTQAESLNQGSLPINAKKFLAYPYKPDKDAIIFGKEATEKEKSQDEFDITYIYIPQSQTMANISEQLGNPNPFDLKFDIYMKKQIICGYPKEDDPQCRSVASNGVCGLEELFKTPITIGNTFDLPKELNKKKTQIQKKASFEANKKAEEAKKTAITAACNVKSNLADIKNATASALDTLYSVGSAISPLMNKLPIKCLTNAANDGKNLVCAASRKAQDKSSLEDFDKAFSHKVKTLEILAGDAKDSINKKFSEGMNSVKAAVGPVTESMGNLMKNTTLYSLCNKRFKDHLDETGAVKSIGDGLTSLMKTNVLGTVDKVLGSCASEGLIEETLSPLKTMTASQKSQFKKLIQTGDTTGIMEMAQNSPEMLAKWSDTNGNFSLGKFMKENTLNPALIPGIQLELTRKLNPISIAGNLAHDLTDISFLENQVNSVTSLGSSLAGGDLLGAATSVASSLTGSATAAASSVAESIGFGKATDNLVKTLKGESIGSASSATKAQNSDGIIGQISSYIDEKDQVYHKLKGESALKDIC